MSESLIAWIIAHVGLAAVVLARTVGLAWTAPALATPALDVRVRLCFGGLLAVILMPAVEATLPTALTAGLAWPVLGVVCAAEVLIGAALGWSAALVVAGALQAGELVCAHAGLPP